MRKIFFGFLVIAYAFLLTPVASAAGKASLYFGNLKGGDVYVGDEFSLPVNLRSSGELLDTIRMKLAFDPEKLEVVHVSLSSLFPNASPGNIIDNQGGIIFYGGFRINGQTRDSGEVALLTFKAKSPGGTQLAISDDSWLLGGGQIKNLSLMTKTLKLSIAEPSMGTTLASDSVNGQASDFFRLYSLSHADGSKWYNNRQVVFQWEVLGPEPLKFFFAFDNEPGTTPSRPLPEDASGKRRLVFEDVKDGLWYFHLMARNANGVTKKVHYSVKIDGEAPNIILPYVDKDTILPGEHVAVSFGTIDQLSGMDFYRVSLDNSDLGKKISPVILTAYRSGEHMVRVYAYDRAGNYSEGAVKLTVLPVSNSLGYKIVVAALLILLISIIIYKRKKLSRKPA